MRSNNKKSLESRVKALLRHRRRLALLTIGIVLVAVSAWAHVSTLGALAAKEASLQACFVGRFEAQQTMVAIEETAASLAGKLQFAQDSLRQTRRDLVGAQDALEGVWRQLEGLRENLEQSKTHEAALEDDLDRAEWTRTLLLEEMESLANRPAETVEVRITETVTLPPDTIPIRVDSWRPTRKGWVEIGGALVLGVIVRSLFESDDTQTIRVERQ